MLDDLIAANANPEPQILRGRVAVAPGTAAGDLFAVVDSIDPDGLLGPCRFTAKGTTLPAVGDAVLVAFDDYSQPWAIEWWPASGVGPDSAWQPGDVKLIAYAAADPGWLVCDGALYARAAYPALFAKIGTAYNVGGEAGTAFRVPDLRSRVPVGMGDGGADLTDRALGARGGKETHALQAAELAGHSHGDGTLAVASHSHDDGTLAVASHSHDDGTLAVASHSHDDGTLAVASHTHDKGTLNITSSGSHTHNLSNGETIVSSGAGGSAFSSGSNWTTTGIAASSHAHPNDYFAGDTGSASPDVSGSTGSASPDVTGSTGSASPDVTGSTGSASPDVTGSTGSTGSGTAHENMPPFAVLNYAIKA